MEELHAAIARHLRMHRLVATTERAPQPTTRRAGCCRSCGQEYTDGNGQYHMGQLTRAGFCAYCFEHEARRSSNGLVADPVLSTRKRPHYVTPLCKRCGTAITGGGEFGYGVTKLQAERECADCYTPF